MTRDNNKKTHYVVLGGKGGGQAENVEWNDILNKPEFATVATSGSYNDLTDKPTVTQEQADWNQTDTTAVDYIKNKPTIPAEQVNSDWNANSGVAQILNKPNLATVATSGSYDDLSNKPTIPSAQVNSDWDATSGVAQILNKPELASVATSGSYNDLSDKPEIPSVPAMATQELTFTLEGGTKKTIEFYTVPNYFYVEDVSGSDNTLSITKNTQYAPTIEVFSSTDKVNWTSIGTTSTTAITATIPSNGKLYLKANTHKWASYGGNDANIITASGTHNVGGNIMSLLYGDDFENKTGFLTEKSIFPSLFANNNKLINANKLILPATTLVYGCYQYMFASCTSLTTAPALPATTLADYCYQGMFQNCTSLTAAPALPATTLVYGCYQYMFQYCTSLTTAPELPATTLASYCYQSIFRGCTKLTTAPALPATELASNCYNSMFNSCTSLTTAPELPATTLASFCYSNMFTNCRSLNKVTTYATDISEYNCLFSWLQKVAATGDFFNLGNPAPTYPSGESGIPDGWTVHTSL